MRGNKRGDGLDGMVATPTFLRDKIAELKKQPVGVPDDHFVCIKCQTVYPNTYIGHQSGHRKTVKQCKGCCGRKRLSASKLKATGKAYARGNLPWFAKL